jgi:hypothetical protein
MSSIKNSYEGTEKQKYMMAQGIFLLACALGDIEKCEELFSEFDFRNDFDLLNTALQRTCKNGIVDMCKWLIDKFNLSASNVKSEILNDIFQTAALFGKIGIAELLIDAFGKPNNMGDCFYIAYKNDKWDFVTFMFRKGMLDKSDIEFFDKNKRDVYLWDIDRNELLKICKESSQIGLLTKAVKGSYVSSS